MEIGQNLKNSYLAAYAIACKELIDRDPEEISINTNAVYDREDGVLTVKYLNRDYSVNCHTGEVATQTVGEEVATTTKILILHYLLHSRIRPLSGNLVSFKDLRKGAAIYYPSFHKRAVVPLLKTFGNNLAGLFNAAYKLGGVKERYGHASVSIQVLPLVPVTYVLWQGDEEAPASATILFDDSVESFLPAEDIVCAASFGVYELIKILHSSGS
ncbi:MAG: DUF3786 domain-containing protein [Clostridiales bacterium]|nr:DUF3786 domain-containing protein [Eubacteriales bacterium]MDH7565669.1 DUF3786 domain-containing protein [Clostridiales bacterium]